MVRVKNPDQTRQKLLESAFEEMHAHGYAGASLERILESTGVTKGALYYHFKNKAELGRAVLEEVVQGMVLERWLRPLAAAENPIDGLLEACSCVCEGLSPEQLALGCPLNNLTQELVGESEEFRSLIDGILGKWRDGIAEAFAKGQAAGTVRGDVVPERTAAFIVAAIEGIAGTMKSGRDVEVTMDVVKELRRYIEGLRAEPALAAS